MPGELDSFDRVLKTLTGIPKQVAFATSRALNDTGRDVQQFTVSRLLPEKFTLRAKGAPWFRPGTKFGFNLAFATKTRLEAVIGSRADWLGLQESGGTKTAGGHRVAIPTEKYKPKPALMRAAMKPRSILAVQTLSAAHRRASNQLVAVDRALKRATAREAEAYNAGDRAARAGLRARRHRIASVYRRTARAAGRAATRADRARTALTSLSSQTPWIYRGRKMPAGIYVRQGGPRLPLLKLFTFKPSVRIPAILQFGDRGMDIAHGTYLRHFNRRLTETLLTAK